jgi:NAD(P)-dependent dehydrogenase (short-subunit alcohol dehydrogenase family)
LDGSEYGLPGVQRRAFGALDILVNNAGSSLFHWLRIFPMKNGW